MKRILFYILIFIFIYSLALINNAIDMDYWARILQGNAFWQLGTILKQDPFSYTQTHLWLDHEWGSSIIFSFIQNHFGYIGIHIFRTLLVTSIFILLFETIRLREEKTNTLLCLSLFIIGAYAIPTITMSALRCHFFTFFFFSLFIFLLEYIRKHEKYRLLIALPLIMILWVNIHGGCVSGLGLLFMYALGEFINKRKFLPYIYTMLACTLVMFINPYGFEYVKFIFMATTMPRPFVTEWISPFAHNNWLFFIEFKIFYIINLIILLFNLKKFKQDAVKYIILIICAYLSFKYIKNTPFFIITSIIFLYGDILSFFKKFKVDTKAIYYVAYFFVLIHALNIIVYNKPIPNISLQPYKVVEFIKINELKGNILAPFDMGSYITYKLYPNNLIYMDGRYEEVYFKNTKDLLDNFYNVTKDWDKILDIGLTHDYIITPRNGLINDYLGKRKDYAYIYADEDNCLFIRNEKLKSKYYRPSQDYNYYLQNALSTDILFVVK
ncbi:MAG: hypothetical protein E7Z90_07160 [Cyanobacteria bacterium SIG29]|nr:hypothetical protein [Cyanobacteria bacterium SIG29]